MYLAYGWPQSIPLDPDDSDRVVLLRVLGRLLLAVCPASLHLWSAAQHRVRLARFDRSPDSLAAHGQNAHAVWSPDAKTVAVLVSPTSLPVLCSGLRTLGAATHRVCISLYAVCRPPPSTSTYTGYSSQESH
jgi:hypothetical protein